MCGVLLGLWYRFLCTDTREQNLDINTNIETRLMIFHIGCGYRGTRQGY